MICVKKFFMTVFVCLVFTLNVSLLGMDDERKSKQDFATVLPCTLNNLTIIGPMMYRFCNMPYELVPSEPIAPNDPIVEVDYNGSPICPFLPLSVLKKACKSKKNEILFKICHKNDRHREYYVLATCYARGGGSVEQKLNDLTNNFIGRNPINAVDLFYKEEDKRYLLKHNVVKDNGDGTFSHGPNCYKPSSAGLLENKKQ